MLWIFYVLKINNASGPAMVSEYTDFDPTTTTCTHVSYKAMRRNAKNSDTRKIAVIIL